MPPEAACNHSDHSYGFFFSRLVFFRLPIHRTISPVQTSRRENVAKHAWELLSYSVVPPSALNNGCSQWLLKARVDLLYSRRFVLKGDFEGGLDNWETCSNRSVVGEK